MMKNVQVIDEAINATYGIYSVTDEEFFQIFPEKWQNIEFIEGMVARIGDNEVYIIMNPVWNRIQNKGDIVGIHGALFYGLLDKKKFYPDKIDPPLNMKFIP